jgi:hypothetical protein
VVISLVLCTSRAQREHRRVVAGAGLLTLANFGDFPTNQIAETLMTTLRFELGGISLVSYPQTFGGV